MEPTNILTVLDEIDEKANKATQQPWGVVEMPKTMFELAVSSEELPFIAGEYPVAALLTANGSEVAKSNAEFITALINAYPQLSSELRRAMKVISELQEMKDWVMLYERDAQKPILEHVHRILKDNGF